MTFPMLDHLRILNEAFTGGIFLLALCAFASGSRRSVLYPVRSSRTVLREPLPGTLHFLARLDVAAAWPNTSLTSLKRSRRQFDIDSGLPISLAALSK